MPTTQSLRNEFFAERSCEAMPQTNEDLFVNLADPRFRKIEDATDLGHGHVFKVVEQYDESLLACEALGQVLGQKLA